MSVHIPDHDGCFVLSSDMICENDPVAIMPLFLFAASLFLQHLHTIGTIRKISIMTESPDNKKAKNNDLLPGNGPENFDQAGNFDQPDQSDQSDQSGQPDQSGQSDQQGKSGNPEQTGNSDHPGNIDQSGYSDHPGNPDYSGNPDQSETDQTRPREIPLLFGKGFVMGSADVVPGVSGGTMALILGIYARLIFAIKSVDVKVIQWIFTFQLRRVYNRVHWMFLGSVLAGAVSAVLFFTKVVALPVLMHTHPEIIYGLFFGLITGSILLLLRTIDDIGWREGLTVLAGTAVGFRVVTLVPTDTPETGLFVFLSGSLAITAMVLPGISGSFILLILRKYEYILGNIALLGTDRTWEAVMVLFPFGLGMIAGLVLFVRLLSWLFKQYHVMTICVLMGFMAGSLYVIWPFQEREYSEIIDSRELPVQDPEVQMLMQMEPDRRQPEYAELGEIVNPDAPVDEQFIEVRDVRRRLVGSTPYWPMWSSPDADARLEQGSFSLYGGLATILAGFLLVGYLGRKAGVKV